jgi:hypothetical protein
MAIGSFGRAPKPATAREIDSMQQRDRARVDEMPLSEAHQRACALAERWLPTARSGLE